ncbi:ribonucleoprotein [Beauveria brongniartii RCEF 3172]|uniref:Ribonucleoprotein n=1 Tax=Beauveria brongniartii RCEF 3172 TaxID=1081107 RepID=A0A167GD85_9HYPO|nr:ribonucleoprotein [Beauveria brongniartii RCEF 3172]
MEDPSQQQQQESVATSKRIYLGNLLYSVKPGTIEEMLHEGGFGNFEKIHISVDPVSGRNPGYCFVDFPDKASADRALETLDVSIGGRPLKVRPCEPKKPRASAGGPRWGREGGADSASSSPARSGNNNNNSTSDGQGFNRWGDWNSSRDRDSQQQQSRRGGDRQGPGAALDHFDENMQVDGRRLFVGGLGKMIDQEHNRVEMEAVFADFKPYVLSPPPPPLFPPSITTYDSVEKSNNTMPLEEEEKQQARRRRKHQISTENMRNSEKWFQKLTRASCSAAIGKRITARPDESKPASGNRNFCFVDFDTRDEAEAARLALDGIELNGSPITVRTARRQREQMQPSSFRHDIQRNSNGNGNGNGNGGESPAGGARAFASRDWRRRVD